ncbi:MAG: penicillin-binding protein, partial [Alistipes sp.]|nr:penicillin-binding protein [Alistipes sp.]
MTQKRQNNKRRFTWKSWVILFMWLFTLVGVAAVVTVFYMAKVEKLGPMPSFDELENPKTNLATQIYSADGEVIGTYFIENRTYLSYEELFPADREKWLEIDGHVLPPIVAALLATEDVRFFDHAGIDFQATARVGIKTILLGQSEQGGGSTITQQLAKNLYKTRVNKAGVEGSAGTIVAKIQEYVIATQLEHNYTKEEIVAMYLNTVEFSNSNFGIKSAANNFFGKEPCDLSIEEAAVIAGQVKAPGTYAPLKRGEPNPKALERRNTVLDRLASAGAISEKRAAELKQLPIDLSNYRRAADAHNEGSATYFREMVRRAMTAKEPERNNYYTQWDYEQAVKEYNENPIMGWCLKNRKANGDPYDIY